MPVAPRGNKNCCVNYNDPTILASPRALKSHGSPKFGPGPSTVKNPDAEDHRNFLFDPGRVVSCGSALRLCAAHGLQPALHVV